MTEVVFHGTSPKMTSFCDVYIPAGNRGTNTSSDHPCQRTCEWPRQPKTCVYHFEVTWDYSVGMNCYDGCPYREWYVPDSGYGCMQHPECMILDAASRPILVVNKQFPGPSIQVGCK